MTEAHKAERKALIANNESMESPRREFVKTLLSRKTAPKGWQYFTVHAITHRPETAKTAADVIGAKIDDGWSPLRAHVANTTARPEFALLALICAAYENTIQKDSWRSAGNVRQDYLNQLVAWGYTAGDVEQIILDKGKTLAGAE